MTPLTKKLLDLDNCLHRLLEGPAETVKSSAEVLQKMSLGVDDIKSLAENRTGNIVINLIQAAQVNSQVVCEVSKAQRYLDDIKGYLSEAGDGIEYHLSKLIKSGWNLDAIESMVRRKCFEIAESTTETHNQTAKRLGIKRTTYLERRKKFRREEDNQKLE